MTRPKKSTSLDDLSKLVADLVEQVKVLVAAVDDLRCEIEWCARNHGEPPPTSGATTLPQQFASKKCDSKLPDSNPGQSGLDGNEAGESAIERLAAMERELTQGQSDTWQDDWDEEDAPELPTGKIIAVDPELWNSMLDLRPAHVIGLGCCCEPEIGAPYLLAWRVEEACFVRELTDAEALALQRACLDVSSGEMSHREASQPSQLQLGFWQE